MRIAGPGHTPAQLAKVAYRKHVRLARLEGGGARLGGAFTVAGRGGADLDPEPDDLLHRRGLPRVRPAPPDAAGGAARPPGLLRDSGGARAALDGVGKRLAQAMVEKAISHRSMDSLHRRLEYLLKRLARRYAARWIPLIGAPLGALQNGGSPSRSAGSRSRTGARATRRDRGARRRARVVETKRARPLRSPRAAPTSSGRRPASPHDSPACR